MPVAASTVTAKLVRNASRLCGTMLWSSSRRAISAEIGTQSMPAPSRAMKVTCSRVTFSAAPIRSPSFSRDSSSVTMTTSPRPIAAMAFAMPAGILGLSSYLI